MSSLVTHVTKLLAYGGALVLTGPTIGVGLAVGVVLLVGSYVGKRILDSLPERAFTLIIEGVLVVSGLTLLISG